MNHPRRRTTRLRVPALSVLGVAAVLACVLGLQTAGAHAAGTFRRQSRHGDSHQQRHDAAHRSAPERRQLRLHEHDRPGHSPRVATRVTPTARRRLPTTTGRFRTHRSNGGVTKEQTERAHRTCPSTGRAGAASLIANFNGIDDATNVPLVGGHLTPPDQALASGRRAPSRVDLGLSGNRSVVVEGVNQAVTVYDANGNVLPGPFQPRRSLRRSVRPPVTRAATTTPAPTRSSSPRSGLPTTASPRSSDRHRGSERERACLVWPRHGGGWELLAGLSTAGVRRQRVLHRRETVLLAESGQLRRCENLYGISKSQLASLSSSVIRLGPGPWTGLASRSRPSPATGDGTATEYLLTRSRTTRVETAPTPTTWTCGR